jgi:hypothetical protein
MGEDMKPEIRKFMLQSGFNESKEGLFWKRVGETALFMDYRKGTRRTYAYKDEKSLPKSYIEKMEDYILIKEWEASR